MRVLSGEFGEAHSFTRLCWENADCTGLKKQPSPNAPRVTLAQPGRWALRAESGLSGSPGRAAVLRAAVADVGAHARDVGAPSQSHFEV